ncbi:MAG: class I SAM-dependent rRNA methyltransferase [Acidobacteriota bacterium]|nr:class I SAM-dependent rRNA methyltransferase [Acidobacteriota bacterium]
MPAAPLNEDARPLTLEITRRAADRLRAGHLWVYRSDVAPARSPSPPGGSVVTAVDSRGMALGSGLYSSASEIALRVVSPQPGLTRAAYLAELRTRLHSALELRRALVPEADWLAPGPGPAAGGPKTDACRLVFSEADALPGIILDRYAGLAVLQLVTQGTAQADVRDAVAEVLADRPWAATLVERGDGRLRELEQIDTPPIQTLWSRNPGDASLQTTFTINDLRFAFDAAAGQKTGAFLDQRLNYAAAAGWAKSLDRTGRALDVCTYQGGFALHLARVCDRVTGVDASRAALEIADRNHDSNASQLRAAPDWVEADAFELLRDWQEGGQRFDTIVLDPPAFAKTKRAVEGALRGYKELNLRAMRMLSPGGLLVTCSCSFHVSLEDFTEVLRAAAVDCGRRVQLLDVRGAAPDHPAVLTLPETRYLKCLVCSVS